jgi:hypothetical protein
MAPRERKRKLIPAADSAWLDKMEFFSRQEGTSGIRAFSAGEIVMLLRARKSKKVDDFNEVDMQPTDGLMVWIEERPIASTRSNSK